MEIRKELASDICSIHKLTEIAFATKDYSDGLEPTIIDNLRIAGDLTLSLVAIRGEVIVGHVAFSPVVIGDQRENWFGLGPISVQPEMQKIGIGSALVNEGLDILKNSGAHGCALIGDPNYYSRFGFVSDGCVHYSGVPDEIVQWLGFTDLRPNGQLTFRPAFGG